MPSCPFFWRKTFQEITPPSYVEILLGQFIFQKFLILSPRRKKFGLSRLTGKLRQTLMSRIQSTLDVLSFHIMELNSLYNP